MVFLAADGDLATMGLHHLIHVVQSEAEAGDTTLAVLLVDGSTSELVEDDALVFLRDANAIVVHLQQDVFVAVLRGDGDADLVLRVLDGVVDEVRDGFLEILLISQYMLAQQVDGKVDGLVSFSPRNCSSSR